MFILLKNRVFFVVCLFVSSIFGAFVGGRMPSWCFRPVAVRSTPDRGTGTMQSHANQCLSLSFCNLVCLHIRFPRNKSPFKGIDRQRWGWFHFFLRHAGRVAVTWETLLIFVMTSCFHVAPLPDTRAHQVSQHGLISASVNLGRFPLANLSSQGQSSASQTSFPFVQIQFHVTG